jgi:hypothetical protein
VQKYSLDLKRLRESTPVATKPSFAFKRKTTAPVVVLAATTTDVKREEAQITIPPSAHSLTDISNSRHSFSTPSPSITALYLLRIASSVLTISIPYSSIHINTISNSLIYCPVKIDGSMLISNMKNCIIILKFAQQVRIHDSSGCRIFLKSRSGPIIEDCEDMHFGEYPRSSLSDGEEEWCAKGGEMWRDVQDFNWLKQTPSPNFDLDARIDEEYLRNVVSGDEKLDSLIQL